MKTEIVIMQKTIVELMKQLNIIREKMFEMQKSDTIQNEISKHSQLKKQNQLKDSKKKQN